MRNLAVVVASLFALSIAACGARVVESGEGSPEAESDRDPNKSGSAPAYDAPAPYDAPLPAYDVPAPAPADTTPEFITPPGCYKATVGSASVCQPFEKLMSAAIAACRAEGRGIEGYASHGDCGDVAYHYITYNCCTHVDGGPVDSGPPPEGGSPSDCLTNIQGSEGSCKSVETWKSYAASDCATTGRVLTTYTPLTTCGGANYRYVQYTCCRAPM